ncbi:MAG TPA: multiheme c-type cytochrome [Candidatus Krumholzibacteria bacterium]|nr:multiheme c-type cytochrome [Candidatus Krumholzibacteria bacterium]
MARRATFFDNLWAENRAVLTVDGGDLFGQRTRDDEHQTEFLCEATADFGYDGIGLGEFDLNYGEEFLHRMMEQYHLPFTSANVRDTTGALVVPEFLVVERGGIRFGLVSVLDPAQRIMTLTGEEGRYVVADPVQTLREVIPRIRQQAQTIVLLGHLGDTTTETVIREVKGIDIAVIGHTFRNLTAERVIDDTILLGSGYEGRFIGRADLFVRGTDGKVMAVQVKTTDFDDKIPDNPEMAEKIAAYKKDLQEFKEAKRSAYPRAFGSEKEEFLADRSCMGCHREAWDAYASSAHYQAFGTLRKQGQTDEPECLSCHTTGYQYKNGYADEAPFNRLINVQCEACHGYGTEHDRGGAWKAQAKDSCVACHDQKNSPNFDYATYWEKIKH